MSSTWMVRCHGLLAVGICCLQHGWSDSGHPFAGPVAAVAPQSEETSDAAEEVIDPRTFYAAMSPSTSLVMDMLVILLGLPSSPDVALDSSSAEQAVATVVAEEDP